MKNPQVNVLLIEDDSVIRESYSFLINQTDTYQVIGAYPSAETALKQGQLRQADIVLLDMELPGINGLDALPLIKAQAPETAVLMLTVYEDPETVFEALRRGAAGYLTKDISADKLVNALSEAITGGGPMSAHIARMVVSSFQKSIDSPLTRRETEILEHIANGKTRSRIASELFIDIETVKSHLKNIYSKLEVHSRADAIKAAKKNRYI